MSPRNWQLLGGPRPRMGETPQIKWWQRLLSGGMAALVVAGSQVLGMLRSTEEIAYRALFNLRGPQSWHSRVAIIAIDEASTEKLDRHSWSREQYAKLLKVLTPARPSVVVLDILMSNSTVADLQLAESMQVPVVMLMAWDNQGEIILPTPELRKRAIATGHVVKHQDSTDGITRKIKPRVKGFLALAIATYKADSLSKDSRKLPNLDRPLWVNWPGPAREVTQHSFREVITGRVDMEVFRDKVVLVGTTVRGFDPLYSPFDINPPASCIHLQAAVISNLLQQNYLREIGLSDRLMLALLLLSGPGLSLLMASRGLKWQAMVGLVLCGGWAIVSFGLFQAAYLIPVVQPIALFSLTTIAVALQERLSMKARLKLREQQLWQQVFYDRLTGLPNRYFLIERLSQAIALAELQADYLFAVLFVDLDRFKAINAQYGHLLGDRLLAASAGKLEACLRTRFPEDNCFTLAHFGADKFTIMLDNLSSFDEAIAVAQEIHQAFESPLAISGQKIFSSVSIGIVFSDACSRANVESEYQFYEQPDIILRDAEIAMYQARVKGQAFYAVFDRNLHDQAQQLLELETDLRRAIAETDNRQGLSGIIDGGTNFARLPSVSQFCLYYQPIISLDTGLISGFEALVRWQHPSRGMVSPVEFIPLAEKTGTIATLGRWILREACNQLRLWRSMFPSNLPTLMVVNLSPIQLRQLSLQEQINSILQETGLDSSCLKLEITESSFIENYEAVTDILNQIRETGIKLSIDDFGTGYSSLGRLQDMPIDTLKIDRSFIMRTSGADESWEIIKTIITLAHNLGMNVVAEGIETPEHLAQLRRLQCDYGQGYFFARPLDAVGATALLVENRRW